jgi:hypothetical protein
MLHKVGEGGGEWERAGLGDAGLDWTQHALLWPQSPQKQPGPHSPCAFSYKTHTPEQTAGAMCRHPCINVRLGGGRPAATPRLRGRQAPRRAAPSRPQPSPAAHNATAPGHPHLQDCVVLGVGHQPRPACGRRATPHLGQLGPRVGVAQSQQRPRILIRKLLRLRRFSSGVCGGGVVDCGASQQASLDRLVGAPPWKKRSISRHGSIDEQQSRVYTQVCYQQGHRPRPPGHSQGPLGWAEGARASTCCRCNGLSIEHTVQAKSRSYV